MKSKALIIALILCLGMMTVPLIEDTEGATFTYDMSLKKDFWNFKSYPNQTDTYSSVLYTKISYCTALVGKNSTTDYWYTYWPSYGLLENFLIEPGDGLFILVSQDTIWNVTINIGGNYTRGDLWVDGNLSVSGNSNMDYNLTVNGSMTIDGNFTVNKLTVTGNLTANGNLTVDDNLTVGGNLNVTQNLVIGGDLTVTGTLSYTNLEATNDVWIGNNLAVGGNCIIGGDLTVNGTLSYTNLEATNDVWVGNNLAVGGTITVDGNLTVNGTLSYTDLTLSGNLTVDGRIIGSTGRTADFVVVANGASQWWIDQADLLCDGTADDVQIQYAIDNCPTGEGMIKLSPGIFDISTTLDITWGKTIYGSGIDATVLLWSGSTNSDIVIYNSAQVAHNTARGGGLYHLMINGDYTAGTVGIRARWTWYYEIENVRIWKCVDDAIILESTYDTYIHQCDFSENNNNSINMVSYDLKQCTYVKVEGCIIGGALSAPFGTYGIEMTGVGDIIIEDCWFESHTSSTYPAWIHLDYGNGNVKVDDCYFASMGPSCRVIIVDNGGMTVTGGYLNGASGSGNKGLVLVNGGSFSARGTGFSNWGSVGAGGSPAIDVQGGNTISIVGCGFGGTTSYSARAINISGGAQIIINDNTFRYGGGIYSTGVDSIEVSNNVFENINALEDYVIYLGNSLHTVSNNNLYDCKKHGIYLGGVGVVITGNTISKIGQDADNTYDALVFSTNNNVVKGNVIYNSGTPWIRYGIATSGGDYNIISGNVIQGASTADIYFSGTCDYNVVVENVLRDGTITFPGSTTGWIVKDNIGFVTENIGYNASITNGFTVTHGLAGIPTSIVITPAQNTTVWVTAITTTTFTVGLPDGTYDIYWYAIYKP